MQALPLHILSGPDPELAGQPLLSVDGAWGAPGLNLSHWPGNTTPPDLRHDLSTGSALRFGALGSRRRRELLRGLVAVANNHYDTDGACALFALLRPEEARPRAERLLAVASAGDFFQLPDEHALAVDAVVGELLDHPASPLRSELEAQPLGRRHLLATRWLVEALPDLLDGDLEPLRPLWEPRVEGTRRDLATLRGAARRDEAELDWTTFALAEACGEGAFDAGRHALLGSTPSDRVLAAAPLGEGTSYRLLIGTLSWFDLTSRPRRARPDLAALAQRLDRLEGGPPGAQARWRHQDSASPSPELWFGGPQAGLFAERCGALAASRLPLERVRAEIRSALQDA